MRIVHGRAVLGVLLGIAVAGAGISRADSTWVDHYRAATAARQAGDLAGARDQLMRVRTLLGETPGLSYQLAKIAARLGDREGALRGLGTYAASGLTRDVAADTDFVALRGDTAFEARVARIRDNARPVERATMLHTFSDAGLLTEDVAWDARSRRYLVTSIVRGEVLAVDEAGAAQAFAASPHAARWGLMGAGVDVRRRLLWVSEVATPTCAGWSPADSGRTGLLAFALDDGRLVRHLDLPADGREHALGDLCVGPDGTVYASDGPTGAVLRLRPGADSLETLVPPGTFGNPQAPALAPDGRRLYVADYGRGIGIVELATRRVGWVGFEPGIALQGIDGLNAVPGALFAVQNGVRPQRVMRFTLDAPGSRVIAGEPLESGSTRLGEPTHGVVADGAYVFLAGTGWDRVGRDQRLVSGPDDPHPALLRVPIGTTGRPRAESPRGEAARPSFGIEAGVGWAALSKGDLAGSSDPSWRGGVHGGLMLGLPLRGRLRLVTGLRGYRHAYGDRNSVTITVSDGLPPDPDSRFTADATEDVDLDGVAVPVRLEWRPLPGAGLRVGLGGEVGYLLRAWSHGSSVTLTDLPLTAARARVSPLGVTADIFEDAFSARDATSEFERWGGAVTAGAGYDLAVAGRRLTLDARFHQGLTDVRRRGAADRRLSALELGLGVWF